MASVENLTPSPDLQAELERLATIVFKPKGSILFRRGEEVCGLFLVCSGQISLGFDCETPIYPARILGPGAIAGLPATVSGNPYSLTAKVVEDSKLAFVPCSTIPIFLKENPVFCLEVMDILSREISDILSAFRGERFGPRSKIRNPGPLRVASTPNRPDETTLQKRGMNRW